MSRIRILFLVTDLALGGTPRSVESLVLGLDRTRFEAEVITLMEPSPITESLHAAGIPCVALRLRKVTALFQLWPLIRQLRERRYDIVHAWLFHANVLARLSRWVSGAVVITSERGVEENKSRFRVWLDGLTSPAAHLILGNAEAVRRRLIERDRIAPEKIRVLENGVDLARYRLCDAPVGPPKVICVARLDPIKSHKDLLVVMPSLVQRFPGITLELVGDGVMRSTLESQVRSLGLESTVVFSGSRSDVADRLAASHLFVLPSLSEGMPGSLLEAMATGLPVVATAVGGTSDLVVPDETGILVPPSDPDRLGAAMASLLSDPERSAAMGRAGRRRVEERFTRESFIRRHQELYEEFSRGRSIGKGSDSPHR